ncbi:hypothetical protein CBR_g20087 [Chara braunii]|uniref:Uncharacterized protein n=1 Tax=Chara braunii TaxID=69332 RepID=A0A388KZH7_CHABU|nr:hypothetical protein CBR_g20087 [Chara braunii]|eukprot:GBG75456.1 hypothetical protein CBR_g20087 [Chara braunii]
MDGLNASTAAVGETIGIGTEDMVEAMAGADVTMAEQTHMNAQEGGMETECGIGATLDVGTEEMVIGDDDELGRGRNNHSTTVIGKKEVANRQESRHRTPVCYALCLMRMFEGRMSRNVFSMLSIGNLAVYSLASLERSMEDASSFESEENARTDDEGGDSESETTGDSKEGEGSGAQQESGNVSSDANNDEEEETSYYSTDEDSQKSRSNGKRPKRESEGTLGRGEGEKVETNKQLVRKESSSQQCKCII